MIQNEKRAKGEGIGSGPSLVYTPDEEKEDVFYLVCLTW